MIARLFAMGFSIDDVSLHMTFLRAVLLHALIDFARTPIHF